VGFIAGYQKAHHSKQVMSEIQDTAAELKKERQQSFDPRVGITNVNSGAMDRLRNQLEDASTNLSGNDALVAQGMAVYIGQVQTEMRKFQGAVESLRTARVLDLSTLNSADQIAPRKKMVEDFLSVNDEVAGVVSNSEQFIQTELESLHVSQPYIDQTLAGFRSSATQHNALILQIRQCDHRSAQSMLGMLALLENNWGKWNYDPTSNIVTFDDPTARASYAVFGREMKEANEEEISLQRRLVNIR
jgi:hypothetical protein